MYRLLLLALCAAFAGCGREPDIAQPPQPERQPIIYSATVSPDGRHIAVKAGHGGGTQLWLVSDGDRPVLLTPGESNAGPACWSPDSQQLAFNILDKPIAIKVLHLDPRSMTTLVTGDAGTLGFYLRMQWSPVGDAVAYWEISLRQEAEEPGAVSRLWVAAADGRSSPRQLAEENAVYVGESALAWSRDGGSLYYTHNPKGPHELLEVDADSGHARAVTTLPESIWNDLLVRPSPDGRWLLVYTDGLPDCGDVGVWLVPAGGGETRPVADFGGWGDAAWCSDGRRVVVTRAPTETQEHWGLEILDTVTGQTQVLTAGNARDEVAEGAPWTPQGEILFVRDNHYLMSIHEDGTGETPVMSVEDLAP